MIKSAPKKKAPAKPKEVVIPPNPARIYGACVFSVTTGDKAKAASLVGKHGFRCMSQDAAKYHLQADSIAYASYKGKA